MIRRQFLEIQSPENLREQVRSGFIVIFSVTNHRSGEFDVQEQPLTYEPIAGGERAYVKGNKVNAIICKQLAVARLKILTIINRSVPRQSPGSNSFLALQHHVPSAALAVYAFSYCHFPSNGLCSGLDPLLGVFTGILAYYLYETNPRTAPPADQRLKELAWWKLSKWKHARDKRLARLEAGG